MTKPESYEMVLKTERFNNGNGGLFPSNWVKIEPKRKTMEIRDHRNEDDDSAQFVYLTFDHILELAAEVKRHAADPCPRCASPVPSCSSFAVCKACRKGTV